MQHTQNVERKYLWSYAQEEALVAVSEKGGDGCYRLITDPERRAKRIAARYADLYFKSAEKSQGGMQLYWPALAAFVVEDIVEAYRYSREQVLNGGWRNAARTSSASALVSELVADGSPYEHALRVYAALAKGNLSRFMDTRTALIQLRGHARDRRPLRRNHLTTGRHPMSDDVIAPDARELSASRAEDQAHVAAAPAALDAVAVARLYGEPLFAMPTDLYIPPDALEVFLEAFEGPLDLLLYLIRRQNFNILDIPMASVTRQYLTYVDQIRKTNLELASEYLLMAAMLIEIKSRMLLPPKKSTDGAEPEDPRAELVRRLIEYEQMKLAAARIDALPLIGRDFLRAQVVIEQALAPRLPDVNADDLRAAWADIVKRATLNQHHTITREQLSVREHMSIVLRALQGRRFALFEDLFDVSRGPQVLVVTFIAMLELARERLLEVTQAEAFAPIYVRLAYAPA
jgi:segregation and condensation protein A